MPQDMLQFVSLDARPPKKRSVKARTTGFEEIYPDFSKRAAAGQAARCSQCGVPFCQQGCPLSNTIPDWLMMVAQNRLEEAYALSSATNTMPEICGRICPQDRLCEGICTIEQSKHGAVTIGAVERYITDTAWDKGWVKPVTPAQKREQSAGIIGAGPAGLAAAEVLRGKGYDVTIYDRYDRGGGLLSYGIPGFKLEKHIVRRRIERLAASGIVFKFNTDIGKDISFDAVRTRHDTLLIATGVYKARALALPGSTTKNTLPALDYLIASNRKGFGEKVPAFDDGTLDAAGKHVVVIGGGDTAMDCVRTAIRQGATSVTCLYRRDRANMPGSAREVINAEEEGVHFEWLAAPKRLVTDKSGAPKALKAVRMRLGLADASGRAAPEETGEEIEIKADMIITALGFDPENLPALFSEPKLAVNQWGVIETNPLTGKTSLDGVYAAGDIARGAALVVWAIRDGLDAAHAMHNAMKMRANAKADA